MSRRWPKFAEGGVIPATQAAEDDAMCIEEPLGVDDLWEQVDGVRRLLHPGLWSAFDGRRDMLLKIVEDQDGWRQELSALLSRNGADDE